MLSYKSIFWNKQISVEYNSLIFISNKLCSLSQLSITIHLSNYVNAAIKCLYLKITILKLLAKYTFCTEILCLIYIIIAFYNWITFH